MRYFLLAVALVAVAGFFPACAWEETTETSGTVDAGGIDQGGNLVSIRVESIYPFRYNPMMGTEAGLWVSLPGGGRLDVLHVPTDVRSSDIVHLTMYGEGVLFLFQEQGVAQQTVKVQGYDLDDTSMSKVLWEYEMSTLDVPQTVEHMLIKISTGP